MKDQAKTKQTLIGELASLRDRIAALEKSELEHRQAQEALQEIDRELKALFKSMINAFVLFESVFDRDGNFVSYRFVYINDAYERITGVKNDEVKGKTVHEVWPNTEASWVKAYGDVATTGVPSSFDMYHEPTGKLYHCNVYRPWSTKDRFCVVFEDITDRRRMEDALREGEEKYRILFENAAEAIFIAQDGKVVFVNPMTSLITGYSAEEIASRPFVDFIHADDRGMVLDRHNRRLKGDAIPPRYSFRILHKNGGFRWVELDAVIINWKGRPASLNFMSDITERKRMEEELQRSNTLLNLIVENIPNMIFLKDAGELRFTRFNRAGEELLGHSRGDLLGKNDYDFFPKEQADFFTRKDREVLRGKEVLDIPEEPIQTRNRGERILHTKKVPILNANGEPEYLMGISEDITDRKRAEKALYESHALLNEMGKMAKIGGWELNAETLELHWTDETYRIHEVPLGYKPLLEEAVNYFHPEERGKLSDSIQRALKYGEAYDMEIRFITAKGNHLWTRTICIPQVVDGKTVRLKGIFQDITDRKRAENELQASEEKYRLIFEHSPLGLLSFDEKGVITACNNNFVKIIGSSREKLIGLNMLELPNEKIVSAVRNTLAGSLGFYEGDYSSVTAKKITPVRCLFAPMDLGKGQIPGGVGIIEDITERKLSEEHKKEMNALLRIAGEKAKLGGWSVNLEDNRVVWSDEVAAIHEVPAGYSPSVEKGISFYAPEWRERITKVFTDCAQKGIPYDEEMEIITAGGKRVWVRTIGEAVKNDAGKIIKVQGAFQDITDRKQAEETLRERESILQKIFDTLPVGLWFADKNGKLLRGNQAGVKIWGAEPHVAPSEYGVFKARRLPSGKDIAPDDWALAHTIKRGMTIVDELLEIDAFDGKKKIILNYTAPVMDNHGEIQGAIVFNQDITDRKRAEEQLQQTLESLRKAVNTTIQVMVSAVESRDPYTAGHQIRAANLARAIATEMGLPKEKIDGIRMAGSIHDIGKLSIPSEILTKPTKLTSLEFSLIKEHSQKGFEMLKDVESPWPLAQIVYQHHERMDGSGYPRQLKGEEIIIEARILAVADVVEAMASHRPYRSALGLPSALAEIEKNRGTLYDADAVDACLKLFREKGFQLEGA